MLAAVKQMEELHAMCQDVLAKMPRLCAECSFGMLLLDCL